MKTVRLVCLVVMCSFSVTNLACVEDAPHPRAAFWSAYAAKVASSQPAFAGHGEDHIVSISVSNVPLSVFLREIVRDNKLSVVCDVSLDQKSISVDVRDRPLNEVLQLVARRVGAQLTKQGGTYYLGTLLAEDKGVLVRRVARLSSEELSAAVQVLLSENGRAHAYPDGLVVVGDKVEVLQRVGELLDRVEAVGADTWVLQAIFVRRHRSTAVDVGLDTTIGATVAIQGSTVQKTTSSGLVTRNGGHDFNDNVPIDLPRPTVLSSSLAAVATADTTWLRSEGLSLNGVLTASVVQNGGHLLAAPLLLLADGDEGTVNVGQRVPIARRNVSSEGTVTTVGYDFIQTGTLFDAAIREVDQSTARVKLSLGVTSFDGYSPEGGPIVSPSEVKTVVSVTNGGVYLVGSLATSTGASGRPGPLSLGFKRDDGEDVIDVWLRVYRVGAPVSEAVQTVQGVR